MKNIISALAIVALFVTATPALAAMPNFVGTGYKQASNCTVPPDRGIWEDVAGKTTLTGCITVDAWNRAKAISDETQAGVRIAAGQSVKLVSGFVDTCPTWLRYGCVTRQVDIAK